jgi:hypothetical protein
VAGLRPVLPDVAERLADVMHRERGLLASMGDVTEAASRLLRRSADILEPVLRRAQRARHHPARSRAR